MVKIPQFQNEEPIMQPVSINSDAKGFLEFAKAFGSAQDATAKMALKVEKETSNAMLMQSANLSANLKTKTQIELLQNPNNAAQIVQNAKNANESIKQSSVLNKQDRKKLDYIANRNQDEINLKAAQVNVAQTRRNVANRFWDNYPSTNKQIQDAIEKHDFKTAKDLED